MRRSQIEDRQTAENFKLENSRIGLPLMLQTQQLGILVQQEGMGNRRYLHNSHHDIRPNVESHSRTADAAPKSSNRSSGLHPRKQSSAIRGRNVSRRSHQLRRRRRDDHPHRSWITRGET